MENNIKEGDMVVVKATKDEFNRMGLFSKLNINELSENPHKVSKFQGDYSVVCGFVINTKYLVKCEPK